MYIKLAIVTTIITSLFIPNLVSADFGTDIAAIEDKLIDWRRQIHANPELSNREFKTAELIAKHLRSLGMEVKTEVAHTGVVGILKGDLPGPLLALRADMDALPVTEQTDVPFASKVMDTYRGEQVGVMHACGHDTHVAILMATAEVFANNKDQLKGTLMFIFQPAEEGAPEGEEGGAELMIKEGLFEKQKPQAVFGMHVSSSFPSGVIGLRSGPAMAASDSFEITVVGKQTHGSRPWGGVDPIAVAAQIINNVQTIVSRQTDITKAPAVVSFGAIKGGIRNNIIPDSVNMVGTIRNFDMTIREDIHNSLEKMVYSIAQGNGAEAEFKLNLGYPVTINDEALVAKMLPSLHKVFGSEAVIEPPLITGAEDFSYYALETPGLFFFMGVTPTDQDHTQAPSNHSPLFYVDESVLINGVKAFVQLVQDY